MQRKEIIVELTALLDVVLIIMFAILVQSFGQVDAAQAATQEAQLSSQALSAQLEQAQLEQILLQEENGRLKRREAEPGIVQQNSLLLTLSVQTVGETRMVCVEEDGALLAHIALDWENQNAVANELHALLSQAIAKTPKQVVFLIFQYDRHQIYQTDYMLVKNAIQREKSNPHVYTAEYDMLQE